LRFPIIGLHQRYSKRSILTPLELEVVWEPWWLFLGFTTAIVFNMARIDQPLPSIKSYPPQKIYLTVFNIIIEKFISVVGIELTFSQKENIRESYSATNPLDHKVLTFVLTNSSIWSFILQISLCYYSSPSYQPDLLNTHQAFITLTTNSSKSMFRLIKHIIKPHWWMFVM